MSLPRPVVPGTCYLVTRRSAQRQFLLRPSESINQIILFCLSEAIKRYPIHVHSYCMLSNHYHLVVTDTEAVLPKFMHWFNEYVAKCINASLGRWESVFAPGSYSAVSLEDENAVLDEMVYVAVNPVSARLVMNGDDWPGLRSRPSDIGKTLVAKRPEVFFREDGIMPEESSFKIERPSCFAELSDDGFAARLEEAVLAREDELRAAARAEGKAFLGPRAVLDQSPFAQPKTWSPRRELNPRVATKDGCRRKEALQRIRDFVDAYRSAWRKFREGIRTIIFPYGTYALRVHCGVSCSGP